MREGGVLRVQIEVTRQNPLAVKAGHPLLQSIKLPRS